MNGTMDQNPADLLLFLRMVEAGGLSAAATRCGLPKSTLSRRLVTLEKALGGRLLVRTARRFALTDFGEQVLVQARRVGEAADAVRALADHRQRIPGGLLRVSLPPDFSQLDLPNLLRTYTAAYPQVRLELDLSPRRVDLLAERFDLAVRVAATLPDDATLIGRKLHTLSRSLFASPSYVQARGSPTAPADLADDAVLVLLGSDGAPQPWVLQGAGLRWEGLPPGPLACNSVGLLRELALQGLGIVAMPQPFASADLAAGTLVPVMPGWQLPEVAVWCLTPGRLLPARTRAFADLLAATLSGLPAGTAA